MVKFETRVCMMIFTFYLPFLSFGGFFTQKKQTRFLKNWVPLMYSGIHANTPLER